MAHLIDKHLVERANTTLLLGILWAALASPRSRPASSRTPFDSTATTTADAFRNRFGGE